MVKVIETNLSLNPKDEKTILDHQARVIEVESWESYIEEMKNGESKIRVACIGSLTGESLPRLAAIENMDVKERSLSFEFTNRLGIKMKRLAYLIVE